MATDFSRTVWDIVANGHPGKIRVLDEQTGAGTVFGDEMDFFATPNDAAISFVRSLRSGYVQVYSGSLLRANPGATDSIWVAMGPFVEVIDGRVSHPYLWSATTTLVG